MLNIKKTLFRGKKAERSSVLHTEVKSIDDQTNKSFDKSDDSFEDEGSVGRLHLRFGPTIFYGLRAISIADKKPISTLIEENLNEEFLERVKLASSFFKNI